MKGGEEMNTKSLEGSKLEEQARNIVSEHRRRAGILEFFLGRQARGQASEKEYGSIRWLLRDSFEEEERVMNRFIREAKRIIKMKEII
jgi:hypothetical protein